MLKILIGVVIVTIAVVGTFLILDPSIGISSVGTVVETANTFTVTVEGEVYKEGLTQDELAELLTIDRYELSYYENGQKEIPVSLLMQMAKVLNWDKYS